MSASMSRLNRSYFVDGDPAIDKTGKAYAIGAYQAENAPGRTTVAKYDPVTDAWTRKSGMPTGRAACVPDNCT